MKKLTKMLAAFALLVGVFGVATNQKETVVAQADTIPQGTSLYLKPVGGWVVENPRYAAYFFDGDFVNTEWVDFVKVDYGIYKVLAPAGGYKQTIFTRMEGGENNWENTKDQTPNLIYAVGKNMYDVSSWGDWSDQFYIERPSISLIETSEGISESKVRIWLDRPDSYEDGYIFAMAIGSTFYKPTGYEKALQISGEIGRYFAFYDMPTTVLTGNIGFTIIDSFSKVVVDVPAVPYTPGDNNKVWKVDLASETWSITKGAITERIYNSFFAKVLEGYLTCIHSPVNGYMAFGSIDSNFLPRTGEPAVWNMEGTLSGRLIKDYENKDDYTSGTRETTTATDAFAKYSRMQSLFIANEQGLRQSYTPASTSIGGVILISILSLTSLVGYYFLKSKKFF